MEPHDFLWELSQEVMLVPLTKDTLYSDERSEVLVKVSELRYQHHLLRFPARQPYEVSMEHLATRKFSVKWGFFHNQLQKMRVRVRDMKGRDKKQ